MSDYRLPAALSFLLHLGLLSWGGITLLEQVEYGIGAGGGSSIGVELIERAPKSVEVLSPTVEHPHKVSEPLPIKPRKDDIVIPKKEVPKKSAMLPEEKARIEERIESGSSEGGTGRGGSQATGEGEGDALVSASPAYHRNPAPVYPRAARERRIEGMVRLLVDVDERGGATTVKIKDSSGSLMLDQAAVAAVEKWRFRPAKLLGRNVSSQVEIPIRFKLENR